MHDVKYAIYRYYAVSVIIASICVGFSVVVDTHTECLLEAEADFFFCGVPEFVGTVRNLGARTGKENVWIKRLHPQPTSSPAPQAWRSEPHCHHSQLSTHTHTDHFFLWLLQPRISHISNRHLLEH